MWSLIDHQAVYPVVLMFDWSPGGLSCRFNGIWLKQFSCYVFGVGKDKNIQKYSAILFPTIMNPFS